jgi:hypothetical protein
MDSFKRNQAEGAIAECLGQTQAPGHEPKQALAIRLKRLIETDRELPARSHIKGEDVAPYAIFDGPPPGRGAEVTYSGYGVFALYLAVRLMDAGMPQSEAVWFMRRIRGELEGEHRRIVAKHPEQLIDHKPPFGLEREVKLGFLVRHFETMVFLVVPADLHTALIQIKGSDRRVRFANICRSPDEFKKLIEHVATYGAPIIVIELINTAHRLTYWLGKIEPVKRGRKS